MPKVQVLFWFDVEDCTVPQSDDAAKRMAWILSRHGVRGTMKVVGQKARLLEQRLRYDVIDALGEHDIGFHSNLHGLRPQIAEYLAELDFEAGAAEFERREGPGLADVQRLFGRRAVTYGQPGPNWAPQPFSVLRKWGIPTYVSGYGYVGLDCQPFWYGGLLCTSHLHGQRLSGEAQHHLMGLNFELGKVGELARHQESFSRSLQQLRGEGGLISILNHPCTLVLEEWFSTYLKPRALTEAGYRHFEEFVAWVGAQPETAFTCASELPALYPDRAQGHPLGRGELHELTVALSESVGWVRLGDLTFSAAEAFALVANGLQGWHDELSPVCRPVYQPRRRPSDAHTNLTISWRMLGDSLPAVLRSLNERQEVPAGIAVDGLEVAPADYLAAAARALRALLESGEPPGSIRIVPTVCRSEEQVDQQAAESGWRSVMLPPGFAAPNLVELARLGAWTLKPAVLCA